MSLVRALTRAVLLVAGALIGLGLFVFSLVVLLILLIIGLFTGRRPDLRMVRRPQPWGRRAPPGEVVDVEVREVPEETVGDAPRSASDLRSPSSAPPSLR